MFLQREWHIPMSCHSLKPFILLCYITSKGGSSHDYNLDQYHQILQQLSQAKIPYRVSARDLDINRHRKGMVGIQTDLQLKKYTVQYRVYVHKKDYDQAVTCMRKVQSTP